MSDTFWRRCSTCKRDLGFGSEYYACSVSTCNRKGNAFVFCSVECWQAHVPTMRHRESWAESKQAPSAQEWSAPAALIRKPDGTTAPAAKPDTAPGGQAVERESGGSDSLNGEDLPHDILIVASKLKAYIRARSGMNTSDGVMSALSDQVRRLCDDAIRRAGEDERKTVMDRDF